MKIETEIDGRFRSEYHKGLINLIYTANNIHYHFEKYLKENELSPQQYNVLRILRGYGPKPLNLDFIKKRMLDKHSDISRVIDNLYKKNLIERKESEKDRRQKDITITQSGLLLLKNIDKTEQNLENLMKKLTESEVVILNELLDKLRG